MVQHSEFWKQQPQSAFSEGLGKNQWFFSFWQEDAIYVEEVSSGGGATDKVAAVGRMASEPSPLLINKPLE